MMLRKVLFATLAVVFIVSLCFFVYNQVHAAVTCSASASANSFYSSGSVSPGITNLEWEHREGQSYSGTARPACGGDVEKKEGATICIRVEKEQHSHTTGSYTNSKYELYTVSQSASVRNWDWPSVSKIGYATGSIKGASDTDRAEYHPSGYYN